MAEQRVAPAIGIDLGTTYSCVAVLQDGQVEIITNDQGNRITPSCVAFTDNGRLVGEGAQNQRAVNAAYTIFDAKRLIGRRFSDPKVQEDMKLWPFKVTEGTSDIPKIVVSYKGEIKEYSAEEISSMVLTKMKSFAEAFLGKTVKDAVITVPAYFDDSQRQATKDAGRVAGLNVLQIINEPTSAAIAYDLTKRRDITRETNVLVFDLGGGTFDVSLVTIDGKGEIKVKAVDGDPHLGGQDFNNKMVEHCITQFNRNHKTEKSITENFRALGRLGAACENAKRVLSTTTSTDIVVENLHEGIDFSMSISRAKFEDLNAGFFTKCIEKVEKCLREAKMEKRNVDEVVLVGGSTRIPKVQQLLQESFNGKELCKRIHADEAVAYGAAVLAAKLSGEESRQVDGLKLLDVNPLSLGVRVVGGIMSVLIPRNTTIPVKMENVYVTVEDNQSWVTFDVYQGERSMARYNNLLGQFIVPVPLAPRGEAEVEVVFEIDSSGILSCSGKELTTGVMKKIVISDAKGRLSEDEIKKMVNDAEKYRHEDREYEKMVCARNELEKYIYDLNAEIKTQDNSRRIPKDEMEKMENAIKEAKELIEMKKLVDVDEYNETFKQLKKRSVSIIPLIGSTILHETMATMMDELITNFL